MVFDSLKKVEGSKLEAYIKRKRLVFSVANNITNNRLVRELSDAYFELEESLKTNTDYDKVKEYCKQYLHPAIDQLLVDVGKGIAVRDVIHFITTDGEPLLPDDFFESMVFIEENKLIERVRAEITRLPSPEELRKKKWEEARKKAFEKDLARLEGELQQAKNDLGAAADVQKAAREEKVKNIEQAIADFKKSGEPLSSIRGS